MKHIVTKIKDKTIAFNNSNKNDFFEIDLKLSEEFPEIEVELTLTTKIPSADITVNSIDEFIKEVSNLIAPQEATSEPHPLLMEVVEVAKSKDMNVEYSESILIKSSYSDYFNSHSFYVIIVNDNLAIEHYSDSYGRIVYEKDSSNQDFTPESILDTIQETVSAIDEAVKILNKAPISNF